MFEKYTEKARRAIFFARYEATIFGGDCIEPAHVLLALMREDPSVFRLAGIEQSALGQLRFSVESGISQGTRRSDSADMALSPACKLALTAAAEASSRLHHNHIGTEHLLLGILSLEDAAACETLELCGVTRETVEAGIAERRERNVAGGDSGAGAAGALRHPDWGELINLLARKGVIETLGLTEVSDNDQFDLPGLPDSQFGCVVDLLVRKDVLTEDEASRLR
jgi:ATP-dependent Clp protease ATP-binding subunit ClpC